MKTAKQILTLVEEFLKTFQMRGYGTGNYLYAEVIVNPSRTELMKHFKMYEGMLRFIADPETKKVYFFRHDYLHEYAHKDINIRTPIDGCLTGVISKGFGIKTQIDFYNPRGHKDWSWTDKYFNADINKLIKDYYG